MRVLKIVWRIFSGFARLCVYVFVSVQNDNTAENTLEIGVFDAAVVSRSEKETGGERERERRNGTRWFISSSIIIIPVDGNEQWMRCCCRCCLMLLSLCYSCYFRFGSKFKVRAIVYALCVYVCVSIWWHLNIFCRFRLFFEWHAAHTHTHTRAQICVWLRCISLQWLSEKGSTVKRHSVKFCERKKEREHGLPYMCVPNAILTLLHMHEM